MNERLVSRRKVLGLALIGLGTATGIIAPHYLLPSLESGLQTHEIVTPNGTRIILNDENLPIKCIAIDHKVTNFNLRDVKNIRANAMSLGEAGLLIVSKLPQISTPIIDDEIRPPLPLENFLSHPETHSIPKDVLPTQELNERGIKIIQADATNLFIRGGAFENGEPLSAFNKNGGKELIIVLLDSPFISGESLKDPRYDSIRDLVSPNSVNFKDIIEEYRKQRITELTSGVERMYQFLYSHRDGQMFPPEVHDVRIYDGLTLAESNLLKAQRDLFVFKNNLLSNTEILSQMMATGHGPEVKGWYFPPNEGRTLILLAVGNNLPTSNAEMLYFTPSGELTYDTGNMLPNVEITPSNVEPYQTYPDPKDFPMNPSSSSKNPNSYPYGALTPGLALIHELMHNKLIKSEYDADMMAMEYMRKAYTTWYYNQDNSGYHFVFSLPAGGYILTKSKPRNQNAKLEL